MTPRSSTALLAVALAACSPSSPPPDAGQPDSGQADAGPSDAGLPDAGAADSGTRDSGMPPPLGTGEPSYDAGQHALILRDSFDQYADIAAARQAYRVGRNTDYVDLISGRGGSGNAIRLKYGIDGGTDDILFGPETRLDQVGQWNGTLPERAGPYRHFFFTTWFRPSGGSDPADRDNTGSGVKGFMFWHSAGRYQNAVNRLFHPDGATRGPKGAIQDNASSGLNLYKTPDGRAPLWSRWADGNWHRFTTEIYAGNHASGHFGQRFWLDGELVYSDVDVDVSMLAAPHYTFATPVSHWAVFGNFVTPAAASSYFTLDFDDWVAWTD